MSHGTLCVIFFLFLHRKGTGNRVWGSPASRTNILVRSTYMFIMGALLRLLFLKYHRVLSEVMIKIALSQHLAPCSISTGDI